MKRIICLITALCLILGSFSFTFATDISWNTDDSSKLTQIRNALISGGTIYNLINACNNNLLNINANLLTLMGWLDPSNGGSTNVLLTKILSALTYVTENSGIGSWLADIWQTNSVYLPLLSNLQDLSYALTNNNSAVTLRSHSSLSSSFPWYQLPTLDTNLNLSNSGVSWNNGSPIGNLALILRTHAQNFGYYANNMRINLFNNSRDSQSYTSWNDLNSYSFTPLSGIDGIYRYLSYIQTPVSRLSYVLASDERIEAQEAAAANEEAVVDNFIDNSGAGSASTSDIGSISDLSSGYKDNFGSSASVTGIFNIFDSNNFGWFSQETANQLDTSSNNSRAKSGSEFETPLLDQRVNDIYDALGVKP